MADGQRGETVPDAGRRLASPEASLTAAPQEPMAGAVAATHPWHTFPDWPLLPHPLNAHLALPSGLNPPSPLSPLTQTLLPCSAVKLGRQPIPPPSPEPGEFDNERGIN